MKQPSSCLSRDCGNWADYDVLVGGRGEPELAWWWSQCAEHTAEMRLWLSDIILAVETHDVLRAGRMAPRDVDGDIRVAA